MWVDQEHLRRAAPAFDGLSDDLAAARATLQLALESEGASWGSDAPGIAFEGSYLPAANSAIVALETLTRALAAVGDNLRETASVYEATDTGFGTLLGGGR
ncbi:WXG100 family type VII secretion target [Rhodococcus sp. ABRD24]|nr:WXG100 family type VII secretion target [Rhodococcus sp. ABRD24]